MTKEKLDKVLEKFKEINFDRDVNILEEKTGNCLSLILEFYPCLKNYEIKDRYFTEDFLNKNSFFIALKKIDIPTDFCLVFMKDNKDFEYVHAGVYYKNHVYHLSKKSMTANHINVIRRLYKNFEYFEVLER